MDQLRTVVGLAPYARWRGCSLWVLDLDRISGAAEAPLDPGNGEPLTHALMRCILGGELGVEPADVALERGAYDRPELVTDCGWFDFSVSHSGNVFVLGVSRCGPIGVDVEIIRGRDGLEPSSRWYLTASEWEHLCSLPEPDRAIAHHKMWTAKEAFVKAIGLGVSFGLERVETEAGEDRTMRIGRINESRQLAEGWHLFHRVLTLAAQMAVVAIAVGGSPGSCLSGVAEAGSSATDPG